MDLLKPGKSPTGFINFRADARLTADGLVLQPGASIGIGGPTAIGHFDGALRFRTRFDPASGAVNLRARWDVKAGAASYVASLRSTVAFIELWPGGADNKSRKLKEFTLPEPLRTGQEYELEFRVVGSTLTVRLDGQTLGSVEDATFPAGLFGISLGSGENKTPVTVTSLEYLDLSAK